MSEKDKLEHKERIKRLDLKRLDKIDHIVGKVAVLIGTVFILTVLVITFFINS